MSGCSAHKCLTSGDWVWQAISKSMTAVEASSFPSFQRRGGRAAAGVVSKKSRSLLILFEITNHPVCAAKERDLLINGAATPPSKGGEGPVSQPPHSPRPKGFETGNALSQQIVDALPDRHIEMRPPPTAPEPSILPPRLPGRFHLPPQPARQRAAGCNSRRFPSAHLLGPPAISTGACGCFRKPVRQATAATPAFDCR